MSKFKHLLFVANLFASSAVFTSCNDGDGDNTVNPAEEVVRVSKKHDAAILLCTFDSTLKESIETYDATLADFRNVSPDTDTYLSFTSRTCVNRVEIEIGIARYQPDLRLQALGNAGHEKVAVQSSHIIPGEEYLSLMNTDAKEEFMIESFSNVQVIKSPCSVYDESDVEAVAKALYNYYSDELTDNKNILSLMEHGDPGKNCNASTKYTETEEAMQALAVNKNVFVGTVDYGDVLLWSGEGKPNRECVYSEPTKYYEGHNLKSEEIAISLVPFISIAGDHAHNDLWGIEGGDDFSAAASDAGACWRLKLLKIGFKIDTKESHNGSLENYKIIGLGDYGTVRQIWVNHLKALYNGTEAQETGEDYQ